ncbi:MAG: hypothetical protein FRX49_09054 [Trebouxia sp. A1-2]|nr:MAG: hypothetical protein FRX49_09054 [Trebouxia sp. A1-2]
MQQRPSQSNMNIKEVASGCVCFRGGVGARVHLCTLAEVIPAALSFQAGMLLSWGAASVSGNLPFDRFPVWGLEEPSLPWPVSPLLPVDGTAAALGLSKAACGAWETCGFVAWGMRECVWEAYCQSAVARSDRTESRAECLGQAMSVHPCGDLLLSAVDHLERGRLITAHKVGQAGRDGTGLPARKRGASGSLTLRLAPLCSDGLSPASPEDLPWVAALSEALSAGSLSALSEDLSAPLESLEVPCTEGVLAAAKLLSDGLPLG